MGQAINMKQKKKLYEGEWKDDKWAQAASPNFNSF